MRALLIGTGNRHKQGEIAAALRGLPLELRLPQDLAPPPPPPEEAGRTFEQNARAKALAYARATGLWARADDSGLEGDALGGRPGVLSARFAGPAASDADNNAKLIEALEGVPDEQRTARYVAVLVLASPDRVLATARGECAGRILREPVGRGGFGYDPLFLTPGLGRTFGELTRDEKDGVSHRGAALRSLAEEVRALLPTPRLP